MLQVASRLHFKLYAFETVKQKADCKKSIVFAGKACLLILPGEFLNITQKFSLILHAESVTLSTY